MGNQESYRRVSFENTESQNVVNVSETCVNKLAGHLKQSEECQSSTKSVKNPPKSQEKTPVKVAAVDEDKIEDTGLALEQELQKNNEYWEQRIKQLQERHEKINETWEFEYQKAIDDVDEYFGKVPPKDAETPCSAERSTVLNCYKKNPDQSLLCAAEVQAFSDCMNRGGK